MPTQGGSHMPDGYVEVALDQDFTVRSWPTLSSADNSWTATSLIPIRRHGLRPPGPGEGSLHALWDDVQAGPVDQMSYGQRCHRSLFIARRKRPGCAAPLANGIRSADARYNVYRQR